MKHNIGSRQAAKLAREKYGERAAVARSGKMFLICAPVNRPGFLMIGRVRGEGRSWSEALRAAGVEIPNETNSANVPTPADVAKLAGGGE